MRRNDTGRRHAASAEVRKSIRQGLFLRVREEAEEHEDNLCLQVRWRAVFRCDGTDIPQPGWNIWYSEDLCSETKVL